MKQDYQTDRIDLRGLCIAVIINKVGNVRAGVIRKKEKGYEKGRLTSHAGNLPCLMQEGKSSASVA